MQRSHLDSVHQFMKQYTVRRVEKSYHCNFMGALNLLAPSLFALMTKTICYNLLETFFSQLKLLKGKELRLPKSMSDTC